MYPLHFKLWTKARLAFYPPVLEYYVSPYEYVSSLNLCSYRLAQVLRTVACYLLSEIG